MVSLFPKSERGQEGQSPRKNSVFFLRSFFFCAYATKRKSERMKIDFIINQRIMFTLCFFDTSSTANAVPLLPLEKAKYIETKLCIWEILRLPPRGSCRTNVRLKEYACSIKFNNLMPRKLLPSTASLT